MSGTAFNQTKQKMVQPLGRSESNGLLRVVSRDLVPLQIVIQACEAKQNRIVRRLQLTSLFNPCKRAG